MFSSLPEELNELIVSYLDGNGDLAAICRTNKLGRRIATPFLYQRIRTSTGRIRLLCRALVENEWLRGYVADIELRLDGNADEDEDVGTLLFNVGNWLDTLKGLLPAKIFEHERCEERERFLVILLMLCCSVRVLELKGKLGVLRGMEMLKGMIKKGHHGGLTSIWEVRLTSEPPDAPTLSDMATLLALPSLTHFVTNCMRDSLDMHLGLEAQVASSTLRFLQVGRCQAKADVLTTLFRLTPGLKHLRIEWNSREQNFWRSDWRRVGRALKTLLPELRDLELLTPVDEESARNDMMTSAENLAAVLAPLGTLKMLEHLRNLKLSTIALFGQHQNPTWPELDTLLPSSLEELELFGCHDFDSTDNDRLLRTDPFVAKLDRFVMYSFEGDRCITREQAGRC